MCQVEAYIPQNKLAHEAHIHALANMKQRTIVVIEPQCSFLMPVMTYVYKPGWEPQKAVTKEVMLTLAKSLPPPVFILYESWAGHFSAYAVAVSRADRLAKRQRVSVDA